MSERNMIVGLLYNGTNKAGKFLPNPISIYNGIGIYWSTYIVIVFDRPIYTEELDPNIPAFTVKGKELGVEINYAVSSVKKLDDYRISLGVTDYKNLDDFMSVSYDKTKGNLRNFTREEYVLSFDIQFAPMYMAPKVNVAIKMEPIQVAPIELVTFVNITDSLISTLDNPILVPIQDIFEPISISTPEIIFVTISDSVSTTLI